MSEYIFVTNIFEYSNIRIYSSHSVTHSESLSVIIHGVALNTVCQIKDGKFFAFSLEKNYTGQKKFTRAAPVTIMMYGWRLKNPKLF